MKIALARLLTALFIALFFTAQSIQARESCESPPTLRFSLVPAGDIDAQLKAYQPLFKRIELMTGKSVTVVRPSSYASVTEGLLSGNIDIATLGPAGYIATRQADPNLTPFATIEKQAGIFQTPGPYYHALLIVRADGRYQSIAQLKGRHLALTDPGSTSGSLLPRRQFQPVIGMPLDKYFGQISHSGGHTKSVAALARSEVDAAFVASTNLDNAIHSGIIAHHKVKVLWQSAPIAYDPFVYRGQLCETLKRQIRAAFLTDAAALKPVLDDLRAVAFVPIGDEHYDDVRLALNPAQP